MVFTDQPATCYVSSSTQIINAGMAEEIREHMMGHKLKGRIRDAYFLADPDDLRKTYLRYIDSLNIKSSPVNYSVDEIRGLQQLGCRDEEGVKRVEG